MTSQARDVMLQGLKDHEVSSSDAFMIIAYEGASTNVQSIVTTGTATFGTPTNGVMNLSSNVNLTIPAGKTIQNLQIAKGTTSGLWVIETKAITPQAFPDGGVLIIQTTNTYISVT